MNNIYFCLVARIAGLMPLFMLCRALFYAFNADLFPNVGFDHFCRLAIAGIPFDISAILYVNLPYIVGQTLPFNFRYGRGYQRWMKYLFCTTNAVALFANCVDFAYFRYCSRRTTLAVFKEFAGDAGNFNLAGRFFVDFWWVFAIALAFVLALICFYGGLRLTSPARARRAWHYVGYSAAMVFVVLLSVVGMRGSAFDFPLMMNHAAARVNAPAEASIVLNTPFCIICASAQPAVKTYPDDYGRASDYTPIHVPPQSEERGRNRGKNVFVIILEGFGKENMGYFNRGYESYTPFLDSLAGESLCFVRSFANGRTSNDAISSVLASIPALLPSTYVSSIYANNHIEGLGKLLSDEGYECAFLHGAPRGSMRIMQFANISGIKSYYGQEDFNDDSMYDGHWGIWDEPFFQYAARVVDCKSRPFLAVMFSVTSHHPYRIPPACESMFAEGALPAHRAIRYTDYAVGRFFETASRTSWFDSTLFVVVADHTSGAVHDEYKTSVGVYSIPIMFYAPGDTLMARGVDSARVVQHIDVMPSILGYLDYQKPYFAYGKDIFREQGSFSVNYGGGMYQIIQDEYVLQVNDDNPVALYNYESDPLLQRNLKSELPDTANRMHILYQGLIREYNNRISGNGTFPD